MNCKKLKMGAANITTAMRYRGVNKLVTVLSRGVKAQHYDIAESLEKV